LAISARDQGAARTAEAHRQHLADLHKQPTVHTLCSPARLCAEPDVLALVAFGSRARGEAGADSDLDLAVILRQIQLTPAEKLACWQRFRERLGLLGVGVDLVVAGSADAERLCGSRWHEFGDGAREGMCSMSPSEEGPFPLPAERAQLLALLETELWRCEEAGGGGGGRGRLRGAPPGLRSPPTPAARGAPR
jgi:predicted nucleotidyltransferase